MIGAKHVSRYYFIYLIVLILPFTFGCEDAMDKNPKYQFPEWLDGKVYDVAKGIPELSTFAQCLEKTGLHEVINSSGLYTVMAPSNAAFEAYFANHPEYNSIDDIDSVTLKNMVEFHIILMPYSKKQLRTLDLGGWIADDADDPAYSCFKRETFNQPENLKIKVNEDADGVIKSINSKGNAERKVYSAYNKYVALFYAEHLNYLGISGSDFQYYFDRDFEPAEVYFGGAKLISKTNDEDELVESYSAENGYVYIVDEVVEPMQSGYQHLFNNDPDRPSYTLFGDMINEFGTLTFNEEATYDQPGASEGLEIDMLYDLKYPGLAFNIYSENATGSSLPLNLVVHNGLFAPTDAAFNSFVSEVLTKNDVNYYRNLSQVPADVKRVIINSHMIKWAPYYPSNAGLNGSIINNNGNRVDISDIGIVEKEFGSNVTFVGLDKVVMPQILNSVVAPVLLRRSYYSFYWALYASTATEILQVPTVDYTLFVIPDLVFDTDSTLFVDGVYNSYSSTPSVSRFRVYDKNGEEFLTLPRRSTVDNFSLQGFVYGHIGIGKINGNCRKEFLRNLSGQYIVIDNEQNTVSGGVKSTAGYNGGDELTLTLDEKLEEDYGSYGSAPKNGSTYSIDGWLRFSNITFSAQAIRNLGGERFLSLMKRVGMIDDSDKLAMLDEGEVLTLFLPSAAALDSAQVDTLPDDKLKELLEAHFVLGVNAFTDNINKNPLPTKYYTKNGKRLTLSSDASDALSILSNTGEEYYTVIENGFTNKMFLGWDNGNENDGNTYTNKVFAGIASIVQPIDVVIQPEKVLE